MEKTQGIVRPCNLTVFLGLCLVSYNPLARLSLLGFLGRLLLSLDWPCMALISDLGHLLGGLPFSSEPSRIGNLPVTMSQKMAGVLEVIAHWFVLRCGCAVEERSMCCGRASVGCSGPLS